jgi:hypothetical protein
MAAFGAIHSSDAYFGGKPELLLPKRHPVDADTAK